jgi:hypothetical protein
MALIIEDLLIKCRLTCAVHVVFVVISIDYFVMALVQRYYGFPYHLILVTFYIPNPIESLSWCLKVALKNKKVCPCPQLMVDL